MEASLTLLELLKRQSAHALSVCVALTPHCQQVPCLAQRLQMSALPAFENSSFS